ncbi:ABC transporter permease [Sinomonas susongensis]|uniref:ABC transporter permease n=1 Tax=Sinomonas susongensis TaxID=1324851 RepID=UPI001FE5EF75|nr:ABC transporter permease [Sinomonas susongensis]
MRPLVLTKYHFASLWNWRTSYLGRFIEPVAYLLFLTAGLRSHLSESTDGYGGFALTGLTCLLAFRASTSAMSDVANDRKWGVFAIYTLQGGSARGYLLSIVLYGGAVFLGQFVLLAGCALLVFGADAPSLSRMAVSGAFGLLLMIGWTGVGAAVGGKVQSYATRDFLVTVTSLPVVFTAPLFYPIDGTSGFLRYLASAKPLTYQVAALRDVNAFTASGSVLWAAAGITLALVLLKRADRVSRER